MNRIWIAVIIVLALLLVSKNVVALEYELDVGIGYTRTEEPPEMRWFQEVFPHSIDSDSESWHVGVNFKTPHKPLTISVGYMDLGKFGVDALASGSDRNYRDFRAGKEEIWPLSTWKARSHVTGWYLVGEYDFKHFFIKAGAWLHKNDFTVGVPDWIPNREAEATPIYVDNDDGSQWGAVYGIGHRFGDFSLSYEIYEIADSDELPTSNQGSAEQIKLTYRF